MLATALLLLLLSVFSLSYANGANDNFKGVATLFGSGTTDYRRALAWATATHEKNSVAVRTRLPTSTTRRFARTMVLDSALDP